MSTSSLSIQGVVVTPSSTDYNEAIARLSATSVLPAAFITYPVSPADITATLKFARSQNPPLQIAVKGGGCHSSTASSSDGGIVIDLSRLNYVEVAADKQSVKIGGGALWGDVYSELEKHDLVVVGGNVWNVGVGGFVLGGGYSNLSGFYGLAVDNLIAATAVLANGDVVTCSKTNEPDLFWAIRGAGNQFGAVTELTLKTYPTHGPATVGALAYPGTQLAEVLAVVKNFISALKPGHRLMLTFSRAPPEFYPSVLILPYIEGTAEEAKSALAPFTETIKPVFQQIVSVPTFNAVSHSSDEFLAHVPPRAILGGALFSDLWEDIITKVFFDWMTFTENEDSRQSVVFWELFFRDKITEVKEEDTAYPARKPHYYAVITGRHSTPTNDGPTREWVSRTMSIINQANLEKEGFQFPIPTNFGLGTEKPEDVYGVNVGRLRELKAKYDPKGIFGKFWSLI
ncbi:hypothetical protein M422DRAFT_254662 [Sphaerobolus stellatus SS14]|uniref:FAD-binding PCMH-type domain-containing protein n=1 Tax=Sphaerobolus stellatus (strain SS14) TaxID=990650 RepID=A0A0C9VUI8_SPHS4|nr:hypothetical protein M422DRAFT_254662 [Sphaerobolus stellatus SS14]